MKEKIKTFTIFWVVHVFFNDKVNKINMGKKLLVVLFSIYCLIGVSYLAIPNFSFPTPPPDSFKSQEPADLESSLRQGYFTNYSRAEVLFWYGSQFDHVKVFGFDLKLPTPLLNYPPEEAETLIRDQTSSTFLQEYVHPFRESMFINGFEPKTTNNEPAFLVDGKSYQQKIIVRMVPSNVFVREFLFVVSAFGMLIIYNAFRIVLKKNE